MRIFILVLVLILTTYSVVAAQEDDIKKIYTDITTKINSALLTKKSSIEISGFMSYNYYKTKYNYNEAKNMHLLQIEPIISYFFIDDLSIGLNLSYQYQKIEYETGDDPGTTEQTFIGPIGKYYFGEEKLRPFIFADYLFLVGDNFDGGELGIGGGILYHFTGNFGINLQIKYGQIWSSKDNIDSQSRILVGIGISNFIF